ncbi:hypothetical protein TrRE_jg5594, partial [Triparma retinervis]
ITKQLRNKGCSPSP